MKKTTYLAICCAVLLVIQLHAADAVDQELNETVKRGLDRGILAEIPLEITEVAVNWSEKNEDTATGTFSAKTKTTEGLYEPVGSEYALRKLRIADTQEGAVNQAREKTNTFPAAVRTRLRNAFSDSRLNFPAFYDVRVPKGGDVLLTGTVMLVKHGDNDWQADEIEVDFFSCGNEFTREVRLSWNVQALDNPKVMETIESVIQVRKEFIAEVEAEWKVNQQAQEIERQSQEVQRQIETANRRVQQMQDAQRRETDLARLKQQQQEADQRLAVANESARQRQAALQKQKDDFDQFCKPGRRYAGTFEGTVRRTGVIGTAQISGSVNLVFEESTGTTGNVVNGKITFTYDSANIERYFSVSVNTGEIVTWSVTGEIVNVGVPGNINEFSTIHGLSPRNNSTGAFHNLINTYLRIRVRFMDNMEFSVGNNESSISLTLSEVR